MVLILILLWHIIMVLLIWVEAGYKTKYYDIENLHKRKQNYATRQQLVGQLDADLI